MLQIFDSIKSLISPELVSKAAVELGEDRTKVASATSAIVPSILGALLHKGDTPKVQSILEEAGRSDLLSDMFGLFSGKINDKQKSIGNQFMDALLGDKVSDFNGILSSHTGITTQGVSKLTNMIAPVIAGFLGSKLVSREYSFAGLLRELNNEKGSFLNLIPASMANVLGLSSLSGLGNSYYKTTEPVNKTHVEPVKTKSNYGWLKWLLLLLLLLLLFFWWRSCRDSNDTRMDTPVAANDTIALRDSNDTISNRFNTRDTRATRDTTGVNLPDGTRVTGYRGGMEERVVDYLRSDRYKDAKEDDLKKTWYNFDNIQFETGSASALYEGSYSQLDNLASILKQYRDVKIKIGGYADRRGAEDYNMELSERRANKIKEELVKRGVSANNIITEGFGEEEATHNENASADELAEDREFAIRFTK